MAHAGKATGKGGLALLFEMVLGGLVGTSPHMISASVMALARLLHQFANELGGEVRCFRAFAWVPSNTSLSCSEVDLCCSRHVAETDFCCRRSTSASARGAVAPAHQEPGSGEIRPGLCQGVTHLPTMLLFLARMLGGMHGSKKSRLGAWSLAQQRAMIIQRMLLRCVP